MRKVTIILCLFLLSPASALAFGPLFYSSPLTFSVGDNPVSVCAGDLDGDNDLDLAVTNYDGDNVTVFINLSDRPIIPDITSIIDIPNDQGRQVRISWDKVCFDEIGGPVTVTEYAVYRKIDYYLVSDDSPGNMESTRPASSVPEEVQRGPLLYPPGDWDYLLSVPARVENEYSVVVPTLADSTISEGMYYSTFFVSALTPTPGIYFDSAPDKGYSVDNLSPSAPGGFGIAYNAGSNLLTWDESLDADFDYFRIYRGEEQDFEPVPGNLVQVTTGTEWLDTVDEGWRYYYKLSAVDFSGNESDPKGPGVATGVDMPELPTVFALHQNSPNPFNPITTIRFDLPVSADVTLSVYGVKGQRVRILLNGQMTAGRKSVKWDGRSDTGTAVASGVYFYRLSAGEFMETRKMILIR
jgi:hypothetical protein